jgi:hypothetical protein
MNTKLTLTIEQVLIQKAKLYAKQKGRSLSDIIENYLKVITKEETKSNVNLAPITKSLKGSLKPRMILIIKRRYQKGCLINICSHGESVN